MSFYAALVTVKRPEKLGHTLRMPWFLSEAARAIAAKHGIDVADLERPRGSPRVAEARQELMWVMRQRGMSFPRIGQMLGRDHTTIVHGVRAHERRIAEARTHAA